MAVSALLVNVSSRGGSGILGSDHRRWVYVWVCICMLSGKTGRQPSGTGGVDAAAVYPRRVPTPFLGSPDRQQRACNLPAGFSPARTATRAPHQGTCTRVIGALGRGASGCSDVRAFGRSGARAFGRKMRRNFQNRSHGRYERSLPLHVTSSTQCHTPRDRNRFRSRCQVARTGSATRRLRRKCLGPTPAQGVLVGQPQPRATAMRAALDTT